MESLTTIYEHILANKTKEAPAVLSLNRPPLTYGRFQHFLNETIARLNNLGIGRNDPVALVLPNGPEAATAFLAISSGATVAPLNPNYRAAEYDFYLGDLNAKAVVVREGMDSPVREVAQQRQIPIVELRPEAEASGLFTLHGVEHSLKAVSGPAEADDVALILHTSGTTSRPKMVPLRQHNLVASAGNIRATLQLTPTDRCLNIMPLFHIHGLMAAVTASLTAGAALVCTPGFRAPSFFDWLDQFQPTWYTAVPTMHQAILGRAAANQAIVERAKLRFVRSSSASLAPQVMAELNQLFKAPVVEAYGMTEAAHQMACNPLHKQKAGTVGPAAGPEVAIMAESSADLLPQGQIGEIVIRGRNVTQGYAQNPGANATAFTAGWFRTGDQGFFDADGYLTINGRLKEIINRGGEKISPREVDEILLSHPSVAQALTFAVPDVQLGEKVAAAVVLGETAVSERDLRHFAAETLTDFKVPSQIVFLDEIPKGPTGKLQRIGLAEKLGLGASDEVATHVEAIAAETEVEKGLSELWCTILRLPTVGVNQDFLDVGGDSITAMQLLNQVRTKFAVNLSIIDFFDAATIQEQSQLIEKELV